MKKWTEKPLTFFEECEIVNWLSLKIFYIKCIENIINENNKSLQ